jgi:GTPase SAR1 family protein
MFGINEEIKILMFGRSGVGKTSTLTAIYNRFVQAGLFPNNSDIRLFTTDITEKKLDEKLEDLSMSIQNDIVDSIQLTEGISGSADKDEFHFFLANDYNNRDNKIDINFLDIPGGWLDEQEKKRELQTYIENANIILIPIDTPPLIESKGMYNERFNGVGRLMNLFTQMRNQLKASNKLVLFVPLKSEKYLNDINHSGKIKQHFFDKYDGILDFLKGLDNISIALTPIQTLGRDVRFSYINEGNFIYSKQGVQAEYRPVDTEQPLIYILLFSIAEAMRKREGATGFFASIFSFVDNDIKTVFETLSNHAKRDGEFAVIHKPEMIFSLR